MFDNSNTTFILKCFYFLEKITQQKIAQQLWPSFDDLFTYTESMNDQIFL